MKMFDRHKPFFRKKTQTNPGDRSNLSMMRLTYLVVFAFAGLILYQGWFLTVKREDTINNSYNARLDSFAERVVRGKILSSDGTVLAETLVDDQGNENRNYPYGALFSNVVGYSTRGKTGLEELAHFYLLTSHINLIEQVFRQMSGEKCPGDSVVTTLDFELQQAASDGLGDRRGAVVVMEPDTGKVLVMVSKPGFDPNRINQDWDALTAGDNTKAQLLNRATQGLYPPGSIFKTVMVLEYMRENPGSWQAFHFDCDGAYEDGDYTIRCYHGNAHGSQDLIQAYANSCNGAFASLGKTMNLGRLKATAEELLFNKDLPLSVAYSPSTYVMDSGADLWEVLQSSIGQGRTQTTPIHAAMITAAIANGGMLMNPYLIDRVENVGGDQIRKFVPTAYGNLMSADEAAFLTDMMKQVVETGTGSVLKTDRYTAAGKTGSAEFEDGKETHAWFTGFAPADDPKLAVTVIVEQGGSGGGAAAPIAKNIFDIYFAR